MITIKKINEKNFTLSQTVNGKVETNAYPCSYQAHTSGNNVLLYNQNDTLLVSDHFSEWNVNEATFTNAQDCATAINQIVFSTAVSSFAAMQEPTNNAILEEVDTPNLQQVLDAGKQATLPLYTAVTLKGNTREISDKKYDAKINQTGIAFRGYTLDEYEDGSIAEVMNTGSAVGIVLETGKNEIGFRLAYINAQSEDPDVYLSSDEKTNQAWKNYLALAPIATSGSYNDLTDKPTLASLNLHEVLGASGVAYGKAITLWNTIDEEVERKWSTFIDAARIRLEGYNVWEGRLDGSYAQLSNEFGKVGLGLHTTDEFNPLFFNLELESNTGSAIITSDDVTKEAWKNYLGSSLSLQSVLNTGNESRKNLIIFDDTYEGGFKKFQTNINSRELSLTGNFNGSEPSPDGSIVSLYNTPENSGFKIDSGNGKNFTINIDKMGSYTAVTSDEVTKQAWKDYLTLAAVATSGNYNDLLNKPSIAQAEEDLSYQCNNSNTLFQCANNYTFVNVYLNGQRLGNNRDYSVDYNATPTLITLNVAPANTDLIDVVGTLSN